MAAAKNILLNCDMGELSPGQNHNYDAEIIPYVTYCNIACGFHSGSPLLMEQTIALAMQAEAKIGAHPSYNDRAHFGRRSLVVDRGVLLAELRYQICALKGMVERMGERLHHVKAHGALYNDMLRDERLATQFVQLVREIDPQLKILTLAHSLVIDCCEQQGMSYLREGFADRRYEQPTRLRSRSEADAVLHEPAAVVAQVESFRRGELQLTSGKVVSVDIDTVCLHSDTRGAVMLGREIFESLSS